MSENNIEPPLQGDQDHQNGTLHGTHLANGHAESSSIGEEEEASSQPDTQILLPKPADVLSNEILPGRRKSLSAIAFRAFLLGLSLGISALVTISYLRAGEQTWRIPFFISALSLFHFLEYYITALYNPRFANVSAFLLSQNGTAYNSAHTGALLECVWTSMIAPDWQTRVSNRKVVVLGLCLIVLGQATRSTAMAHASTNFNHTVQQHKNADHALVTTGVYSKLRHPSYFGFFWWGLGTQLVLGNSICFLIYTIVLWSFFSQRIRKEEGLLVTFFGEEYEKYRARTIIGIPFIGGNLI
ncbi:MAG: hypothetical protein M1828_004158 [Chrysothrix sp. TS-e1954]|nr:MAG: hypothetical protein M1828_004158 [Chrysothrix sp. TS-e1954]